MLELLTLTLVLVAAGTLGLYLYRRREMRALDAMSEELARITRESRFDARVGTIEQPHIANVAASVNELLSRLDAPGEQPPEPDLLCENLGAGEFRDISEESGCRAVAPAFGLGTVILDFDLDGKLDIYVGNDSMPNYLYDSVSAPRPGKPHCAAASLPTACVL